MRLFKRVPLPYFWALQRAINEYFINAKDESEDESEGEDNGDEEDGRQPYEDMEGLGVLFRKYIGVALAHNSCAWSWCWS